MTLSGTPVDTLSVETVMWLVFSVFIVRFEITTTLNVVESYAQIVEHKAPQKRKKQIKKETVLHRHRTKKVFAPPHTLCILHQYIYQ